MTRLCTESLCSYSGRSEQHAGNVVKEKFQMGNWISNPRHVKIPPFDLSVKQRVLVIKNEIVIDSSDWFRQEPTDDQCHLLPKTIVFD